MARRLLHLVRFLLLLLSTTVFMSSLFLIVKNHIVFQSAHWTVWVPFIIAFASDIIFWYSLRKRNCVPSMFRNLFLSLLSLAWFVTPSYHIHALLELHGGSQFLQYWSCGNKNNIHFHPTRCATPNVVFSVGAARSATTNPAAPLPPSGLRSIEVIGSAILLSSASRHSAFAICLTRLRIARINYTITEPSQPSDYSVIATCGYSSASSMKNSHRKSITSRNNTSKYNRPI